MSTSLAESYTLCGRMARRAASNFYYAFFLLARDERRAMNALYAYLRNTDDLGDSADPVPTRRAALVAWRAKVEAALAGDADDPILPALVDTVRRYHIPEHYLLAVIDGVLQGSENQGFGFHGLLQLPAHNAPGKQVHENDEIQPALQGADVCHVAGPDLVQLLGLKLRFTKSGAMGWSWLGVCL